MICRLQHAAALISEKAQEIILLKQRATKKGLKALNAKGKNLCNLTVTLEKPTIFLGK